ncbi:hypothetical protein [Nocardioides sp. TF02-7]|uniref:hypothetical protein n=1 Tax=Nocardioides sp. TF02-7 TaxID=2917724 RepID=UPI001F063A45|nr:hypothetical protein [Nocardioides sp. TF02-7]UMG93126.1 hypothetical protein MF408_02020 [Nocardioides sp. TF02-7]
MWASTAVDGDWGAPVLVPQSGTEPQSLQLAAEGGHAVVGWTANQQGTTVLRVARRLSATSWDGSSIISPLPQGTVAQYDLDVDASGRIHAAQELSAPQARVVVSRLAPGQDGPDHGYFAVGTGKPSLDVNAAGDAVVSLYRENTDEVLVSRRATAGSWTQPESLLFETQDGDSVAAVNADGRGLVAYVTEAEGRDVVRVAKVAADGDPDVPGIVSDDGEDAAAPAIALNDAGDAVAAWRTRVGGQYGVDLAVSNQYGEFGTSTEIAAPGVVGADVAPVTAITRNRVRAVGYRAAGNLVLRTRSNAFNAQWTSYVVGASNGELGLDSDSEGNFVAAAIQGGANGFVHGDFFDATGPTLKVTGPGAQVLAPSFPVTWTATDSLSGPAPSTALYRTSAAWNQAAHGKTSLFVSGLPGSKVTFPGKPGTSYCFQVYADDLAGNPRSSTARCTTVPLDDRKLTGTGWKRSKGKGHFLGTVTTTTTKGKTLTRTGVKAKRLALVVARSPQGGKVKVTFAGKTLRTVNLKGTGKRKVVGLATFASVKAGTLKIKVTSANGKRVTIDGLVVAK